MRHLIPALGILLLPSSLFADIKPDSPATPLFQVFQLTQTGPDTYDSGPQGRPTHHWTIDDKHPLLTVYSLDDFLLESDKKAVRVVLTKSDAKIVAEAFKKYQVLAFTADKIYDIGMSSKPFDGSLYFDNPMAAYLRQRFHVTPDTNVIPPSATTQPPSPSH